ncbi:hypothetical protein K437DRAFT_265513 [Tilletiaria anomala UBC 951]|uniref:Uncharacterized protein n=1 Tax=Tilletiaria anomala (strain ATCC 24038 / CBS 436.72 / UBC 951) TaxID=1037660 RepID=A0A066V8V3_TILAU|nr:uncharacterized protein K437DRAFT_265513 [Tilletiaria anomala UBC 951]KDN35179.1 hypothetical protein K437DRAFT_265513 [Tilletiaria anomala UBC 951]
MEASVWGYGNWNGQLEEALATLVLVMDDKITGLLRVVKTVNELWDTLEAKYQLKKGVAFFILNARLWTIKKDFAESMHEYLHRLATTKGRIKAHGVDMSETDYRLATLVGLDSCYNNHFQVLEQVSDQLTKEHYDETLLQEKRRSVNDNNILSTGSSYHLVPQCTALANKVKDSAVIKLTKGSRMKVVAKGDFGPIHAKPSKGNLGTTTTMQNFVGHIRVIQMRTASNGTGASATQGMTPTTRVTRRRVYPLPKLIVHVKRTRSESSTLPIGHYNRESRELHMLERVQVDIIGPLRIVSVASALYFLTFTSKSSGKAWVGALAVHTEENAQEMIKVEMIKVPPLTQRQRCIRQHHGPVNRSCKCTLGELVATEAFACNHRARITHRNGCTMIQIPEETVSHLQESDKADKWETVPKSEHDNKGNKTWVEAKTANRQASRGSKKGIEDVKTAYHYFECEEEAYLESTAGMEYSKQVKIGTIASPAAKAPSAHKRERLMVTSRFDVLTISFSQPNIRRRPFDYETFCSSSSAPRTSDRFRTTPAYLIRRNTHRGSIFVDQTAYATSIFRRFDMEELKAVEKDVDANGMIKDKNFYPGVIRSLLYLVLGTQPDMAYSGIRAKQGSAESMAATWQPAKRVMQYGRETCNLEMEYKRTNETEQSYTFFKGVRADCSTTKQPRGSLAAESGHTSDHMAIKINNTGALHHILGNPNMQEAGTKTLSSNMAKIETVMRGSQRRPLREMGSSCRKGTQEQWQRGRLSQRREAPRITSKQQGP